MPSFGDATIADQSWTLGTAIGTLRLPRATGGDGTLSYRLTPSPPSGLILDTGTRMLTGTPDRVQDATEYTWTATDADGDTATLGFVITVADPQRARTRAAVQEAVKRALAAAARRSVASTLDNIGARFADSAPANSMTLAGKNVRPVASSGTDDGQRACATDAMGHAGGRDGFGTDQGGCATAVQAVEAEELLGASAFSQVLGASGGPGAASSPLWSVWGRGDLGSFAGRPGPGSRHEGKLRTGWLGIDARSGPWVAGLAVSRSTGEADYSYAGDGLSGRGRLEIELTALHPYGRWTTPEGLEFSGVLGAGRGEARHRPDGGDPETSDLSMRMGSAGVRRPLAPVAGLDFAMRGDASFARMETVDGPDLVDGLSADSWRLRAGVEASRRITLGEDAALTPFVEAAVRQDGGDGLSGTGVEVAGGLRYTAPRLVVEARGRWLASHTEEGARERGASVTVRMGPGAHGRGLSLAVSPRWGAATGGAEALWRDSLPQPAGLSTKEAAAMDASVGYGVRVAPHVLLTPFAETGLAEEGGRRLAVGTRLEASRMDLGVELAGERREDGAAGSGNLVRLGLGLRF